MDDYSAHCDFSVTETLKKRLFLINLPAGITGDLQMNDTDLRHDLNSYQPRRDEIMQTYKSAWNEPVSKVDIHGAFKRNAITKSGSRTAATFKVELFVIIVNG